MKPFDMRLCDNNLKLRHALEHGQPLRFVIAIRLGESNCWQRFEVYSLYRSWQSGVRPSSADLTVVRDAQTRAISESADSTLKVWSSNNGHCLPTFKRNKERDSEVSALAVDCGSMHVEVETVTEC